MENIFNILQSKNIEISSDLTEILSEAKSYKVYNSSDELAFASTRGNDYFEVKYDLPGGNEIVEAIVHRVSNGISVNYPEPYMRRRDPDTMSVADNLPSGKQRFRERYGYGFDKLKKHTVDWLKEQDLGVFFYFAGRNNLGVGGIAIAPQNAAFFLFGLSMLQRIIPVTDLPEAFRIESLVYVAPPFRQTHFEGKQSVVHCRENGIHEIYAYNLYPGPSAKKGLYGALIDKGEQEGWITAHCSTVQVKSPYDNLTTFMHEGASGGGKSEMLQHINREAEGQVKIGTNTITGEERKISIPAFCSLAPVTDDMALCHSSLQGDTGKLTLTDAENAWFIRVDGINDYGDDPATEKMSVRPSRPLLFLNIETRPGCTALLWNHIEDEAGRRCPNPRVIIPREIVPGVVDQPVNIDVRSFGVRTPPSSNENPGYGIIGLFHILPPALAWLWRLVSPRGYGNPSIISGEEMESEGVGSYWPFSTGEKGRQADLLLEQIMRTPETRYVLVPNQHIGVWKVGFKPQLLMREYLTRRGNVSLREDQYQPAACSLLGYELNYLTIEGAKIPSRFLKVYRQPEMGAEGYNKGAEILTGFFQKCLREYLEENISDTARRIIEACLQGASVSDYDNIIPVGTDYEHHYSNAFLGTDEFVINKS